MSMISFFIVKAGLPGLMSFEFHRIIKIFYMALCLSRHR